MRLLKLLTLFIHKYYFLILFFLVLISYGQIIRMYVWQDDNALFFKLDHLKENAGYFGPGPFGEGPYKYVATPYIPIHYFFGSNTVPYFLFNLVLYFLTTFCVYKVFSKILDESSGKLIGFLYACGFIAADGFIRLFNSPITSTSIILISLLFFSYYQYYLSYKKGGVKKWYFLALVLFFLATELARGRTHYLIGVIISFEIIFFCSKKPLKELWWSVFRLIPFGAIFYIYFVFQSDERSGSIKKLLSSLASGNFIDLYSFFSSFANLIVPEWLFKGFSYTQTQLFVYFGMDFLAFSYIVLGLFWVIIFLLLKKRKDRNISIPIFFALSLGWKIGVDLVFKKSVLNLYEPHLLRLLLGGLMLILLIVVFLSLKRYRRLYLFFSIWMLVNIGVYAAYNPWVNYESVNRYLAHSFLALNVLMGIIYLSIEKKSKLKKIFLILVLLWGVGNLISNVAYQYEILQFRSNPPRNFYSQLKTYLPKIEKGDVLYFDVAPNSEKYFKDAFSVASMPETTALAWRYGIDRYDLTRFTDFSEFTKYIEGKKVPPRKIYTFWYANLRLIDTSDQFRKLYFSPPQKQKVITVLPQSSLPETNSEILVKIDQISSVVPTNLELKIKAAPLDTLDIKFPIVFGSLGEKLPENLRMLAIEYSKAKEDLIKNSNYIASSNWQNRVIDNLHDQDFNTAWQPDRVKFKDQQQNFIIDLKKVEDINQLVWVNGFGNNTPEGMEILASLDNKDWVKVMSFTQKSRVDNKDLQIIHFPETKARFIKVVLKTSLSHDSPLLTEAWIVPSKFSSLNIAQVEKYLLNPFFQISNSEEYNSLLEALGNQGEVAVYWKSDASSEWLTTDNSKIKLNYDNGENIYKITIPAGGTKLLEIKLADFKIPGIVTVQDIYYTRNRLSAADENK